jgi:hypothetical protein
MDEGEVVNDVLGNDCHTETGEERLVGESIGAHSGEVTQQQESVDTQHVSDWADIATGLDGMNGYLHCVTNRMLRNGRQGALRLRTIEERGRTVHLNADFCFCCNLFTAVKNIFETLETVG